MGQEDTPVTGIIMLNPNRSFYTTIIGNGSLLRTRRSEIVKINLSVV